MNIPNNTKIDFIVRCTKTGSIIFAKNKYGLEACVKIELTGVYKATLINLSLIISGGINATTIRAKNKKKSCLRKTANITMNGTNHNVH